MVAIRNIIQDNLGSITVPREIVIKNARLGTLYKFLQIFFILCAVANVTKSHIWEGYFQAVGRGVSLWRAAPDQALAAKADVQHCTDASTYHYTHGEENQWAYRPAGCKSLPARSAFLKETQDAMFFPTLLQETTTWIGEGAQCSEAARLACVGGASWRGTWTEQPDMDSCMCERFDEYFAKNPEEQKLLLNHGYEAKTDDTGRHTQRGSSLSKTIEHISDGKVVKQSPGEILTVIKTPTGEPCEVGGKSRWTYEDSQVGIGGPLKDWVGCAGATLDSNPSVVEGGPLAGTPQHMRTMGLQLELTMKYINHFTEAGIHTAKDGHNIVLCEIRPSIRPIWSSRTTVDTIQSPGLRDDEGTIERSQYLYGINVITSSSGEFRFFDLAGFVTGIVNTYVILTFPMMVIQFIALYCVGQVSSIYYEAKRTPFSIFDFFHGICARMMVATVGYRGLKGGMWEGKATDLGGLELDVMKTALEDSFAKHIHNGTLQDREVRRLCRVMYAGFAKFAEGETDTAREGTLEVSYDDFLEACLSNEHVDMSKFANFFDEDRKPSFIERLLDDTRDKVKKADRKATRSLMRSIEVVRERTASLDGMDPTLATAERLIRSHTMDLHTKGKKDSPSSGGGNLPCIVDEDVLHATEELLRDVSSPPGSLPIDSAGLREAAAGDGSAKVSPVG
eukprot:TRINITY_DN28465_c0_g1_i1.p1 TRINITY_DN28465_c0_g1~~TRINITY_DN28465_c0_g1_i1.p1  ORF type:complete len:677 (+),score=143.86 TRINITY_DN28465_c0_g1_i1:190-2220(+)